MNIQLVPGCTKCKQAVEVVMVCSWGERLCAECMQEVFHKYLEKLRGSRLLSMMLSTESEVVPNADRRTTTRLLH